MYYSVKRNGNTAIFTQIYTNDTVEKIYCIVNNWYHKNISNISRLLLETVVYWTHFIVDFQYNLLLFLCSNILCHHLIKFFFRFEKPAAGFNIEYWHLMFKHSQHNVNNMLLYNVVVHTLHTLLYLMKYFLLTHILYVFVLIIIFCFRFRLCWASRSFSTSWKENVFFSFFDSNHSSVAITIVINVWCPSIFLYTLYFHLFSSARTKEKGVATQARKKLSNDSNLYEATKNW